MTALRSHIRAYEGRWGPHKTKMDKKGAYKTRCIGIQALKYFIPHILQSASRLIRACMRHLQNQFIESVPAFRLPSSRGRDSHSKVHGHEALDGQLTVEGCHAQPPHALELRQPLCRLRRDG